MSHSMHVHGHRADSGYANYQASNRSQQLDPIRSEHGGDKRRSGGIEHMDGNQGAGRRNPLVNAMMQALQGLMAGAGGSTNVQSAATAQAANDSSAVAPVADVTAEQAVATTSTVSKTESTSSKGELKDAAAAFAHELFNALRDGAGDDDVKRKGNGNGNGNGHHFGHHHGHGHGRGNGGDRVGGAYSNLAQKLQDLAGKMETTKPVAAPAAATPTPAATTAAAVAETAAPTMLPETAAEVIDASAAATPPAELATPAAASLNINVNININVQFSGSVLQPASAEQPTAASPLLAAFEKLMEKLQPASEQSDTVSSADKLRQFLLGMASSLQSGSAADADSVRPSTGSLINIAA